MSKLNGTMVALLCVLAFVAGCRDGDDCVQGESRCRDNVAEICSLQDSGEGPTKWRQEDCGAGVCVEGVGDEAFCALGARPDLLCMEGRAEALGSVCKLGKRLSCREGFVVASEDCTEPGGYCDETDAGAVCSATATHPFCFDDGYSSACEENTQIECVDGYLVDRRECGAEYCVTTAGGATCLPAPDPDPLCPLAPVLSHVCDDNAVVQCTFGYRQRVTPCEPGRCEPGGSEDFPAASCVEQE